MPTYEYECTECGAVTEVSQSIMARPKRRLVESDNPACDCAAPVVRRVGTGAGIIFKGSGFYQTDYRSEGYKKAAHADKDAREGKKTDGDGKADKGQDAKKSET
ncbi:MAG: zinc ribbon domain-containing protein, partial [Planctomycetes bacterium]|nr:zinc ribbon domain-containing protein [Planctomycetota bacterium]